MAASGVTATAWLPPDEYFFCAILVLAGHVSYPSLIALDHFAIFAMLHIRARARHHSHPLCRAGEGSRADGSGAEHVVQRPPGIQHDRSVDAASGRQ